MTFLDTLGGIAKGVGDFTGLSDAWHDLASAVTDNGEDDNLLNDIGQGLRAVARVGIAPPVAAIHALGAAGTAAQAGVHYATSGLGYVNALSHYGDGPAQFVGRGLFGGFGFGGAAISSLAGGRQDWSVPGESFDQYRNRAFDTTIGGGWDNGLSFGELAVSGLVGYQQVASRAGIQTGSPLSWTTTERDKAFRGDGAPFKFASGGIDLVTGSVVDPTNLLPVVGKAGRLAVAGKYISTSEPGWVRGISTVSNRANREMMDAARVNPEANAYGEMFAKFAQMDETALLSDRQAKTLAGGDIKTFAQIMGPTADTDEVHAAMVVLTRASTDEGIEQARQFLVSRVASRGGASAPEIDYVTRGAVYGKPSADLLSDGFSITDPEFRRTLGDVTLRHWTDPDGSLTRAYETALGKVARNRDALVQRGLGNSAVMRIRERVAPGKSRFGTIGDPTVTVSQPTKHHPIMAVVDFFTKGRPSQYINFDHGDSVNDIAAMLHDINRVTGNRLKSTGEDRALLNLYIQAAENPDRQRVAWRIEQRGFEVLADHVNEAKGLTGDAALTPELAQKMWAESYARRAKALKDYRESGYLSWFNPEGDAVVAKMPILERQAANAFPLMDFGQVRNAIIDHDPGVLAAAFHAGRTLEGTANVINDIFKMSVLLRIGYPIRNVAEAGLSMFASGYLGAAVANTMRDAGENIAASTRRTVARGQEWLGARTGSRRTAEVARNDLAVREAMVRHRTRVLDGLRESAVARAQRAITPEDADLLRRAAREDGFNTYTPDARGVADNAAPLTADERARVNTLRSTLSQMAELRAETTRTTTYHMTTSDLTELSGDYIDTTPSFGVANGHADSVWTPINYESTTRTPQAFADPYPMGGEPPMAPRPNSIPNRLRNGYHAMLDDAIAQAESGRVVQQFSNGSWRTVSAEMLRARRERAMTRADARLRLRSRDAAVNPEVKGIVSYGEDLNLTRFADWPDDLKDRLNVRTSRDRTTPQRRANRPSHAQWVRDKKWNDPEVAAVLTQYAKDNGFGRIILPDGEWGQTVRVVSDYVDGFGRNGAQVSARRSLDRIISEAEQDGVASALPITRTAKQEREARRALRRTRHYPGDRRIAHPVNPQYADELVNNMVNNGDTIGAIRQAVDDLAAARVDAESARTSLADVEARIAGARERMTGARPEARSRRVVHTADGPVEIPGAAQGPQGEIIWRQTSGDPQYNQLVNDGSDIYAAGIPATENVTVRPGDPNYYQAWSNVLNFHWRDPSTGRLDPMAERLVNGQSVQQVKDWLRTAEGKRYRDSIGWDATEGDNAVEILNSSLSTYLPDQQTRMDWAAGNVNEAYLSQKFGNRVDLPEINGLLVPTSREFADRTAVQRTASRATAKLFHWLGSMPETTLARHPLYTAIYEREMSRRVARASAQGPLSLEDVNLIAERVREEARQKVEKTLFTINRRTGAAKSLRLVAPFYAAWENVIKRWGGFVVNETENVARLSSQLNRVLNNATLINSETGEKADPANMDPSKTMMVLPFKVAGWDQRVSLASLDVITQGQPLNPGIGPFVAWPLVKVMESQPRAEEILSWAFPAGIPRDANEVWMPAAVKRAVSAATEDQSFINDANRIAQMEYIRYQRGERSDIPQWSEIESKARQFYGLKLLTNLVSPYSPQYTNEVNYYTEELRRYRGMYGDQADQKFLEQRPEAFVILESLSKNASGARATYDSVDNLRKYGDLAAEADAIGDPKMLGWIANFGQGNYDPEAFSQAAYNWQLDNSAVPGGDTFRAKKNPMELLADAEVNKGWIDYRQYMDIVESQMTAMGYDPGSVVGQQLLSKVRPAIATAVGQGNDKWLQDYKSNDAARFEKRVDFFNAVLSDPKFMADHGNDSSVQSLAKFLRLRDEMGSALLASQQAGGAKSISAKSNAQLAQAYYDQIAQLKASDLTFADWYDRYFTNDPVVF